VRFSSPSTDLESQTARSSSQNPLFPYRDSPSDDDDTAGYRDHVASNNLSNTQIHAYHQQVLHEQDAQLDALGASIARQRELSMQIGDELDDQVLMLDESERVMDRQTNALGRARRQIGRIARGAAESGEGRQMTAIVVLIIVLVLLIAILK
jgi:syntaxin 8